MKVNRQTFLTATGAALVTQPASAAQSFRVLRPAETRALAALGETLVRGARDAGIVTYVDDQLAAPPHQSLLMLQYFDVPPPFVAFYRDGLAALDAYSTATHEARFADADPAARSEMVRRLSVGEAAGWAAPPAPLFYLAVRGDAMDVVYGTVAGFATLHVPYMPHIRPASRW